MRSTQSTLFTLLLASSTAYADTTLNLTPGVSPISHDIYQLHMTVFWICVVIGVLVFGAMFYSIIYHRKSKGVKAADFHSHTWIELTWTIVPAIILVLMMIPATKVLLNMNNYAKESITIKVTGYQWKWHYEYLEDGVSFFSNLATPWDQINGKIAKTADYLREVDHPLVVPIHKKIRFLITSNDVNHAWWVPAFGIKRDAISGFINEAWTVIHKPGVYRGQCAELCGVNHAFMPIVVVATTDEGYKDFIAKQKGESTAGEAETNKAWTQQELMTRGEQVYTHICAACHQAQGTGLPPTFPALKGSKVTTGAIEKHVETVMNGVSGTAMQAFKNQLSPVEIAAVITYERNAWGNNTNTMIQPIQVKAFKDGKTIDEALAIKPSAGGGAVPTEPSSPAATKAEPFALPAPAAITEEPSAPEAATNVKPADKTATNASDLQQAMARGEKVYLNVCAACHQPTGLGLPPTFPALKGSKITTGLVNNHIHVLMDGKKGTAMVAFKDQLSDQEIADVITYERNAWGNNTGSLVKADDIKTVRQQELAANQSQKIQEEAKQ